MLVDLFYAGQETTANTIGCIIIYLLNRPGVLAKAQTELDAQVGGDRMVNLADRARLPYLNAVILEGQRVANVLAINIFHATTEDVVLRGHRIPKGTCVIPQVSTVMLDEKVSAVFGNATGFCDSSSRTHKSSIRNVSWAQVATYNPSTSSSRFRLENVAVWARTLPQPSSSLS